MKSLDSINGSYEAAKKYNRERLTKIGQDITAYKKVAIEDIVTLSNAATQETDQGDKAVYNQWLACYNNKDIYVQKTLVQAEELLSFTSSNPSLDAHLANNVLNAVTSELADNKPIAPNIQAKLLETLRERRFPSLTATIFVILYKIYQRQENDDNFINLATHSIKLVTGADIAFNRNILKITEDVFNKTGILVEGANENLIRLAADKKACFRLRDAALNLLIKAAASNTELSDIDLLKSNIDADPDDNIQVKSLKLIELMQAKALTPKIVPTQIKNEQDEHTKLEQKEQAEIIALTKKIIGLEGEEQSIELDKLVALSYTQNHLPPVMTADICRLINDKLDKITHKAVLILSRLVAQGAKVELNILTQLANTLVTQPAGDDDVDNIIDILSRHSEFTEFISSFKRLRTQSKILLEPANLQQENAAKFLYEYSKTKPLPVIILPAVRKGLDYSTSSPYCLKALAAIAPEIELSLSVVEQELIAANLNHSDLTLAQAAKTVLSNSGVGIVLIAQNDFQAKLASYFPGLNVTNTIAGRLTAKMVLLGLDEEFVKQLSSRVIINDFAQLDRFLDFVAVNNIAVEEITDCLTDCVSIRDLERKLSKLELEAISNDFSLADKVEEFQDNLSKLIDHDWSLINIKQLLNQTRFEDREELFEGIRLINEYAIAETQACQVFACSSASLWQSKLYATALVTADVNVLSKNQYVLLQEISALNKDNAEILELVESDYLSSTLNAVVEVYNNHSTILAQNKAIKDWQAQDVTAWAKSYRQLEQRAKILPEVIAVIDRANYLHTKYRVRPIQIAALLILLKAQSHGRLLQIATGEGKSTITAMLAVVHALHGEYVDIITSSSVLAKRDCAEKSSFYGLFELSCGHNTERTIMEGVKPCYKNNIVYGDVANYQFDLLNTEYKKYATRSERTFGVAIVDEVDSMLIDEGGKIAKISSPIAGMEYLEPLLVAIWQQLNIIQSKYTYLGCQGQLLWINGEFSHDDNELVLLAGTTADDVHLVEDSEAFTAQLLEDYIASLLQQGTIAIPNHLCEFVNFQAKYWAKSAISAMYMEENRHYILKEDDGVKKVTPVDYNGTGVVRDKTQWVDGLHQFLEIKHGLRIKPESLTGCFISNMGYFIRYGNKIYGMTGTLGSDSARELLQTSYKLDFGFIPTYKTKRFYELASVIKNGSGEWLQAVTDNVLRETNNGRSCLVISETIADSIDIERTLKQQHFTKIINYSRSDDLKQAKFLEHELDCSTVIVATNLAGRGTDIKTSVELESKGGLHVVLTFLPTNLRVEQQAFGRTARQGNIGSGQLIINGDYERAKLRRIYPDYEGKAETAAQLKTFRDLAEVKRIEDIKTNQVPKLTLEDALFNQFKDLAHGLAAKEDNKYKLLQLEELWGLHFKNLAHEQKYSSELETKAKADFEKFSQKAASLFARYNIINNPAYLIRQAAEGRYAITQAINFLKQAIALDDKFSYSAGYYLASNVLAQSAGLNQANPKEAAEAATYLKKARDQITDYIMPIWESMQIMLGPSYNGSMLSNQIFNKIDLLQKTVTYIDSALWVINTAGNEQIVRVKNQTPLDSLYPNAALPKEAIIELNTAGVAWVYELEAVEVPKEPKGWFSNFTVAILGVAQIVVGVALSYVTAGFGTQLSSSIIAEGIKDIYNSVKATITGKSLDLKDYWNDKGISYAIAIATAGINTIKSSVAKQTAGQEVKELTKQSFKSKLVDVSKQAVLTIVEQEGSLALARGISGVLDNFRDGVKKDAISEVRRVLEQPHIDKALSAIMAIDRFSRNNLYQRLLIKEIEEALKPYDNRLYHISKRLVNALSGSFNSLKLVSAAMEVGGYAEAVAQFNSILDKFCADLERIILAINLALPTTYKLLVQELQLLAPITQKQLFANLEKLKQAGIITGERSFNGDLLAKGFVLGIDYKATTTSELEQECNLESTADINSSKLLPATDKNIVPFKLQDIQQPKTNPPSLDEVIDFGAGKHDHDLKQEVISKIRDLHVAYITDYSAEKEKLGQNLGKAVSASIISKLNSGLIQPASQTIVPGALKTASTLLAEHNRQVRQKLLQQPSKVFVMDEETGHGSDNKLLAQKSVNNQQQKLAAVKIKDIARTLADRYQDLSDLERQQLAQEIYRLEQEWQKHPQSRPEILLVCNNTMGDISSSVMPTPRSQAISIVMNKYNSSQQSVQLIADSKKKGWLQGLKDTWESVSQEELRKQKRELNQKWLKEAQEEEIKRSQSAELMQVGTAGSETQTALVPYGPTLKQNTTDSINLAEGSISFSQTQFAALIRQKLVAGDKAIIKIQDTIDNVTSWAVNKFPEIYLSYQVAKAYSLQDSYTAPECKLLSFMNRQADKYIVNPLLQQIGINQGDPGYVTGKIIIDTALAAAITEGVQAKIASPYTVVPAKPTTVTYSKSFAAKYERFTVETNWTSPVGTQQTYKVFQRNDIDWNMIRSNADGPKKFIGKTNKEAALAGYRPELADGNFTTLHHIGQKSKGPIVEASTKQHDFQNPQAFKALHNQFGGKKHPEFPVNHKIWDKEQSEYWKWRAKNEK